MNVPLADADSLTESVLLRRGSIPAQPTTFELDDFEVVGKPLGRGSFGFVHKVVQKCTGKFFAMKVMSKTKILELNLLENVEREISTQQTIRHPNVLRLYKCFEDEEDVHLLLEYAPNGSLFDLLKVHRKRALASEEVRRGLPEPRVAGLFRDVADGLQHLHSKGVVHRDLKPENILVCHGGVVKLADFGWCNQLAKESAGRNTFCGTWEYLSPEMIANEPYDCKVDVWAAGVLLFEMLVGRSPFAAGNYVQALGKISRVAYEFPDHVSAPARDLVSRMLVKEPGKRIDLASAVEHPWVQEHTSYEREESVQNSCSDKSVHNSYGAPSDTFLQRPFGTPTTKKGVLVHDSGIASEPVGGLWAAGSPSWSEATSDASPSPVRFPRRDRATQLELARSQQEARAAVRRALRARSGTLLESALKKALVAGLEDQELDDARKALAEETKRSEARKRLMRATQRRSAEDICQALAEADELQIPKDSELVEHARAVLASLSGYAPDDSEPRPWTKSAPNVLETPESASARTPVDRAQTEPAAGVESGSPRRPLPAPTTNFLNALTPVPHRPFTARHDPFDLDNTAPARVLAGALVPASSSVETVWSVSSGDKTPKATEAGRGVGHGLREHLLACRRKWRRTHDPCSTASTVCVDEPLREEGPESPSSPSSIATAPALSKLLPFEPQGRAQAAASPTELPKEDAVAVMDCGGPG